MLRWSVIVLGILVLAGGAQAAEAPKVRVESGVLAGTQTERARIFRNVPYAPPPDRAAALGAAQPPHRLDGRARCDRQRPVLPAEDER